MTCELGLKESLSVFEVQIKQTRQRQQREKRACIFHKWWAFLGWWELGACVRAGSLDLFLPGTECRLIGKPCKRTQQIEEVVLRGRTKAVHPLRPSRKTGRQRWILRTSCTPTKLSSVSHAPPWLHWPPPCPHPHPQEKARGDWQQFLNARTFQLVCLALAVLVVCLFILLSLCRPPLIIFIYLFVLLYHWLKKNDIFSSRVTSCPCSRAASHPTSFTGFVSNS